MTYSAAPWAICKAAGWCRIHSLSLFYWSKLMRWVQVGTINADWFHSLKPIKKEEVQFFFFSPPWYPKNDEYIQLIFKMIWEKKSQICLDILVKYYPIIQNINKIKTLFSQPHQGFFCFLSQTTDRSVNNGSWSPARCPDRVLVSPVSNTNHFIKSEKCYHNSGISFESSFSN